LEAELTTYKAFNPKAVGGFVRDFLDTLDFAGITVGNKVVSKEDEQDTQVKVGDFAQWVSQGSEQFHQAKKVTGLSDDGKFVFVEGEKTGIPVNEIEIADAPAPGTPLPPRRNPRFQGGKPDMRQDVFSLDGGGEVVITWPTPLAREVVEDIKDWLKIVERKISRSADNVTSPDDSTTSGA
jgi:hypothetical protein